MTEFIKWPSITRLANETMIISEKLDGSSCAIQFVADSNGDLYEFAAQSRNRFITPDDDNYGFARWTYENVETLFADLGHGVHHGEWWGQGIQRKYGMDRKVFSLFNTRKWGSGTDGYHWMPRTPNLDVVPVIYTSGDVVLLSAMQTAYNDLRALGSWATEKYTGQRFDKPEGVVALLIGTGARYKINDAPGGKGPKDRDGNVA